MTAFDMRNRIDSLAGHVLFDYKGHNCGVDPFSRNNIDMWYGQELMNAKSVDEVMTAPFFDGNALQDIMNDIVDIEC